MTGATRRDPEWLIELLDACPFSGILEDLLENADFAIYEIRPGPLWAILLVCPDMADLNLSEW
jgi:hypothetical protein